MLRWTWPATRLPAGAARFERREAAQSWRLRLHGTVATLRANLSLDSAACRHAIRLAVCIAVAEALGQRLALTRLYWAPMTVAIVLKPDFGATFTRGALRLAGTFTGLLLATALFHVLPPGVGLEVFLIGLLVFAVRAFGPANYGIAATGITALVVMLVALTGMAPNTVMWARGLNTALGGVVALLAYAIWPTWERTQISEMMARMLDGYRAYFHAIRNAYERPRSGLRARSRPRTNGRPARPFEPGSISRPRCRRTGHVRRANAHSRRHARELPSTGARDDGARGRA